jgi:hypothetical protein
MGGRRRTRPEATREDIENAKKRKRMKNEKIERKRIYDLVLFILSIVLFFDFFLFVYYYFFFFKFKF